ncbi:DUF732 domain-containing protein [Streptodolium elevatio]
MRRTLVSATAAAAAVAAAILLGGCGGGDDDGDKATPAAPPTATATDRSGTSAGGGSSPGSPASQPAAGANPSAPVGAPPAPDAATRAKYIASLNSINPALVDGKEDRAVDRGLDVCLDLGAKKDHATVLKNIQERFGSPTVTVTADEADRIKAVANSWLCPKL